MGRGYPEADWRSGPETIIQKQGKGVLKFDADSFENGSRVSDQGNNVKRCSMD